ncbi:MAG TPA: hypothetical protein VHE30_20615 [Polyangiaceae bacterium]|nr:hypothetical protein [Polyangiaceae bacterium]
MKTLSFALAASLVLAAAAAHADEVQVSDSARQHFKTGVAYLTDPDGARYEEAYREFKVAYADSPSWKILGNLGISAMKLERDGEAVDAFEKYLSGGGAQIDPAERAQMERDLMTTKSGLVWVTVKVQPPGAALTDERQPLTGRAVTNRYELEKDGSLHFGVRRGHHKITVQLTGYDSGVWEFDAEPGADQTHDFALEKPKPVAVPQGPAPSGGTEPAAPQMERPIGVPVIIGAAATGALLVGSGVVGVLAMGKKKDFDDKNDGHHVDEADSARKSAATLNIVGDALLGGAIVAGAVTTYLFLTRPEVPVTADQGTARRWDVSPRVSTNGGGLFVSGRF